MSGQKGDKNIFRGSHKLIMASMDADKKMEVVEVVYHLTRKLGGAFVNWWPCGYDRCTNLQRAEKEYLKEVVRGAEVRLVEVTRSGVRRILKEFKPRK